MQVSHKGPAMKRVIPVILVGCSAFFATVGCSENSKGDFQTVGNAVAPAAKPGAAGESGARGPAEGDIMEKMKGAGSGGGESHADSPPMGAKPAAPPKP